VLFWATVVVALVEVVMGLCLNSIFVPWIEDTANPQDQREKMFEYFGTFTRAMITLTEVTFGNFVPVCRFLTEHVDESYGHAIILYKVAAGFALLSVVRGVFLHETFKAAASDDELMVVQKQRAQQMHEQKMTRFFNAAAVDGFIERHDFERLLQDKSVRIWLSALDVDVGPDSSLLFHLLDDGDNRLTGDELVKGVARLKGGAKSIDLIGLMFMTSHVSSLVTNIHARLARLEERVMSVSAL